MLLCCVSEKIKFIYETNISSKDCFFKATLAFSEGEISQSAKLQRQLHQQRKKSKLNKLYHSYVTAHSFDN